MRVASQRCQVHPGEAKNPDLTARCQAKLFLAIHREEASAVGALLLGRILHAAVREFTRKGFRRARLERIATAAGVAEGTVYHQFGSKQGLLVAVGQHYGEGLALAAFGDLGVDPVPDEVAQIVRNLFAYLREVTRCLGTYYGRRAFG